MSRASLLPAPTIACTIGLGSLLASDGGLTIEDLLAPAVAPAASSQPAGEATLPDDP
jgi:hypothetical protein